MKVTGFTLGKYIVSKSRVEISHRLMEIFLTLKRPGDNLTPPVVLFKMYLLKRW